MSEEKHKINMTVESEQSQAQQISTETSLINHDAQEINTPDVLDETWTELAQDWQAQPTPKTDISALVKRTRRRTRGAKFCFGLNIVATLGLLIVFLYGVYQGELGDPLNTYIGLGSLISLIFVYFETKLRVATWKQLCDSPEKAIDNAIAASESSMKYMWITKISFLPFLPLVNWFIYAVGQTSEKPLLPAFLLANGFMLVSYALVEYLHRKRKKEHQQLLQMK